MTAEHWATIFQVRGACLPLGARCADVSTAEAALRWARMHGAGPCEFWVRCRACNYERRYVIDGGPGRCLETTCGLPASFEVK